MTYQRQFPFSQSTLALTIALTCIVARAQDDVAAKVAGGISVSPASAPVGTDVTFTVHGTVPAAMVIDLAGEQCFNDRKPAPNQVVCRVTRTGQNSITVKDKPGAQGGRAIMQVPFTAIAGAAAPPVAAPQPAVVPQLSSAQPMGPLVLNQQSTFIVNGNNLSAGGIRMSLTNCEAGSFQVVSVSQARFTCIPRVAGSQRLFWKAPNSEQETTLGSFLIGTATPQPTPQPVSPPVPVQNTPAPQPQVSSARLATPLTLNQQAVFILSGSNLNPGSIRASLTNCESGNLQFSHPGQANFTCTPRAAGTQRLIWKGPGSEVEHGLGTFVVEAPAAPVAPPAANTSPRVDAVTPLTARAGQEVTFSVTGQNLPATLAINLTGEECLNDRKPTAAQVVCRVRKAGVNTLEVKDRQGGAVLRSFQFQAEGVSQPTGRISAPLASMFVNQNFGSYLGTYNKIVYNGHHPGTDFRGGAGTPVMAMADGVVSRVSTVFKQPSAGGWYIVIDHAALGVQTLYLHIGKPLVAEGAQVTAGQKLAELMTPTRFPPHLHVEVKRLGKKVVDSKGNHVIFVGKTTTPVGNLGYVRRKSDLDDIWLDPLEFIRKGSASKATTSTDVEATSKTMPADDPTGHIHDEQEDDPAITEQVSRQAVLDELVRFAVSRRLASAPTVQEMQRLGVFQGLTLSRPAESASRMEVALMIQRLLTHANLRTVNNTQRFHIDEFGSTPEASEHDYLSVVNRLHQWGIINGQQDYRGEWRYYPTRKVSRFEVNEVLSRLNNMVAVQQAAPVAVAVTAPTGSPQPNHTPVSMATGQPVAGGMTLSQPATPVVPSVPAAPPAELPATTQANNAQAALQGTPVAIEPVSNAGVPATQPVLQPTLVQQPVVTAPAVATAPAAMPGVAISLSNPNPRIGELLTVNLDGALPSGPSDIYLYVKVEQLGGQVAWYYNRMLNDAGAKPWRANIVGPALPETNPIFQYAPKYSGRYAVGVLVLPAGASISFRNAKEIAFQVQ